MSSLTGKACPCKCRYTFEYPGSWKTDVVNKVCQATSCACLNRRFMQSVLYLQTEKGMQGIDSRVINPKIGKSKLVSSK